MASIHNNSEVVQESNNDAVQKQRSPLHKQILAVTAPILNTICGGMENGYSAILLPQLQNMDSALRPTKDQMTWIASITPLFLGIGCLFGGWIMEHFGRMRNIFTSALIMTVSWIVVYFANTFELLLVARILGGLGLGLCGPAVNVYISEVSSPRYRSIFLVMISFGITFGMLVTHLLGTFLNWKLIAVISTVPPLISLVVALFVPESHIWYLHRKNFDSAKRSYFWYRGQSPETQEELLKLTNQVHTSPPVTLRRRLHSCTKARFLKPLVLLNVYFITSEVTANNVVAYYSVGIMQQIVPGLNEYAAMLLIDATRVVMSLAACVLIKKCKVRTLTMVSGFGTALSLYLVSTFVQISKTHPDHIYKVAPIIPLVLFMIFVTIGLMPLPWTICGEILPSATKGIGAGFSTFVNFMVFFIVVKTGPNLFDSVGPIWGFCTYASLTLAGTLYLWWFLPETKDKTLEEIEEAFESKRFKYHKVLFEKM